MNNIEETKNMCSKIFMYWFMTEKENPEMKYKPEDEEFLRTSFITKIILKKFQAFDIQIHLPIHLLMILSLCTNENPGQTQIVLKDLLLSIKSKKGPIPNGYVITSDDFSLAFPFSFPIMEIPEINKKYEKLWNEQKRKKENPLESDNSCDTVEWWKEVML